MSKSFFYRSRIRRTPTAVGARTRPFRVPTPRQLLLFVLLVLPAAAAAQAPPDPAALLHPWLSQQVAHSRGLEAFSFHERASYVLDGPNGARRVQHRAEIEGGADRRDWTRTFLAVEVNGRPVPPERWDEVEQRRQGLGNLPFLRILQATHLGPQLFRRLEPAGPVAPAENGARWRLDLIPRRAQPPLERVTLWFDRDGRLRNSRILLRPQNNDAPFVVTTEYARVDGLDVPVRRHIEGTVQVRRRSRIFTMLLQYEGQYDDFRFYRR